MDDRRPRREFLRKSGRAALGFALVPFAPHAQTNRQSDDLKELEALIPQLMKEAAVPGVSIALIKGGTLFWRRGFGVRDTASKTAVDDDTVFEAQSMSKPVFAYAVMKLYEKGVIDLDTPLTKYTTERFLEGDPRLDLITARHVLCHTTGFQNWRSEKEPLAIHFTPGERYQYSGEGYSYLESVVTHLVGQAFEPFMKANVLGPFGMTSSGYIWNDTFERRAAKPHDRQGKPFERPKSTAADVARYGSAGALLTTPTDYAKFVIEIIDPKPGDPHRLKMAARDEMIRPQVKTNDAYSTSWALGWQVPRPGEISHGGDIEGFHSFTVAYPAKKSGFVIMANGEGAGDLIRSLILGDTVLNRLVGSHF